MSKTWRTRSNWGAFCGDRSPVREPNVSPGDSRRIWVLEPLPFNGIRDSKCQGSKTSGTWNSTLIKAVRAPFDDQVTMATMYLSGDAKLWWRTRYEDVLEDRCEINAWEELNRKLKERSSSCLRTLHGSHESPWCGPALFEKIKADHGGLTRAIDKGRTLIDRIRQSDIKKRATSLWMVTYELKLMRRVSITKNDSTTNLVSRDF